MAAIVQEPAATARIAEVHHGGRKRPLLGYGFIVAAVALGGWSAWLTVTLPSRHLTPNGNVAWGGFDVIMAVAVVATGVAAWRGTPWFPLGAVACATLLVVDAWFDILTSAPGGELAMAVGRALAAELPLAVLCLVIAARGLRVRPTAVPTGVTNEGSEVGGLAA